MGFNSIEFVIQGDEIDYNFQRRVNMDYYRLLERKMRDLNIVASSVHAPFLQGAEVFSTTARMQILRYSLEITRIIGGTTLVLHPYHIFSWYEGAVRFFSSRGKKVEEFVLPKFPSFVKRAEGANIIVAIENIGHWYDHPLTNMPRNLMRIVKGLNNDSIRAVIDIFHSEYANHTIGFFKKLGEFITGVHLSDISTLKERALPGQGETKWRPVIPAIDRLPHLKHRVLEGPAGCRDTELERSADFLESFLA